MSDESRLNAEWVAVNAIRGITKIATKGDASKATYNAALALGGELYPELLGPETSLLRRQYESDATKEYRQRAAIKSEMEKTHIAPLSLVQREIADLNAMLQHSKVSKNRSKVDQLTRKLKLMRQAELELSPVEHTENQLIFRDAIGVDRHLPSIGSGQSYKDYELPDDRVLRIRVLHPDRAEHITGADVIYERHDVEDQTASIVVVQYKIWSDKKMYLTDPRLLDQLSRLKKFTCDHTICEWMSEEGAPASYRFPHCAAFLRPTDKKQRPDQSFMSTGEHLPICHLGAVTTHTDRGTPVLEYKKMRNVSLSSEMFEELFNKGKIGSRPLSYVQLTRLYREHEVAQDENSIVILAQEFDDV